MRLDHLKIVIIEIYSVFILMIMDRKSTWTNIKLRPIMFRSRITILIVYRKC